MLVYQRVEAMSRWHRPQVGLEGFLVPSLHLPALLLYAGALFGIEFKSLVRPSTIDCWAFLPLGRKKQNQLKFNAGWFRLYIWYIYIYMYIYNIILIPWVGWLISKGLFIPLPTGLFDILHRIMGWFRLIFWGEQQPPSENEPLFS